MLINIRVIAITKNDNSNNNNDYNNDSINNNNNRNNDDKQSRETPITVSITETPNQRRQPPHHTRARKTEQLGPPGDKSLRDKRRQL